MENYKEKYEQAVKVAKEFIEQVGNSKLKVNSLLEKIFPEFKENEDEKIRKHIVVFLMECDKRGVTPSEVTKWFAWLEKQGEQKTVDKVEPKFHVGDKVNRNDRKDEEYYILTIASVNINEHCYTCHQGSVIDFEKQDLWHIVEQKPDWSEEDEKMVESCLLFVNANRTHPLATKCIDWLKSLKPNHWKPSAEQMKALKEACDEHWEPDGLDPLYTLYQDLKKLQEE